MAETPSKFVSHLYFEKNNGSLKNANNWLMLGILRNSI